MKNQKGNIENVSYPIVACVILAIIALVATVTSNEDSAIAAADTQGYTNIEVKSVHRFFSAHIHGCSDWKGTVMDATNPVGKKVRIVVCEGLFLKGATIRSK